MRCNDQWNLPILSDSVLLNCLIPWQPSCMNDNGRNTYCDHCHPMISSTKSPSSICEASSSTNYIHISNRKAIQSSPLATAHCEYLRYSWQKRGSFDRRRNGGGQQLNVLQNIILLLIQSLSSFFFHVAVPG